MKKQCFVCKKTKLLSSFYVHRRMKDGHLNKCSSCCKKYMKERRRHPIYGELIRERERKGSKLPRRLEQLRKNSRKTRLLYPKRKRARNMVYRRVANGTMKRKSCEKCKDKNTQAHHPDYRKPLLVRWLCIKHHHEAHKN